MRCLRLALPALVLVSGCVREQPLRSTASLTVVSDMQALPAPQRSDLTAPDRASFVGPLDTVAVEVFNVPELTREVQVDAGGRISMPLIGTVEAGGKTSEELARSIEIALRSRYVRNPEVTVNIRNAVSQVVTVDGQVVEPGLYPVTNQMTLLRAIASAKGMAEFAKLDDVVVLRTVGNRRMAGLYNIGAIRQGLYADPAIYANDVIVVGDSPQRRLFRDVIALSPLLAAPLLAILQ